MTLRLPTASRSAMCNALVDLLDGGSPGVLKIYKVALTSNAGGTFGPDETAPTNADLLVGLVLSNPAFGAASGGVATAGAIANGTIGQLPGGGANGDLAPGTYDALGFRLETSGGTLVMQGSVSDLGGSGDIKFDTDQFTTGGTVTITSLTVTVPEPA